MQCPGINGTHLDWRLPLEERLAYLSAHATLSQKIGQLTNQAPALQNLYIPSYNWLNDDEHGVKQYDLLACLCFLVARTYVLRSCVSLGITLRPSPRDAVLAPRGRSRR